MYKAITMRFTWAAQARAAAFPTELRNALHKGSTKRSLFLGSVLAVDSALAGASAVASSLLMRSTVLDCVLLACGNKFNGHRESSM